MPSHIQASVRSDLLLLRSLKTLADFRSVWHRTHPCSRRPSIPNCQEHESQNARSATASDDLKVLRDSRRNMRRWADKMSLSYLVPDTVLVLEIVQPAYAHQPGKPLNVFERLLEHPTSAALERTRLMMIPKRSNSARLSCKILKNDFPCHVPNGRCIYSD